MQREEMRKTVTTQVYQSLAEGGVEITAMPQAQLQAIVNALADGLFAALTEMDDRAAAGATSPGHKGWAMDAGLGGAQDNPEDDKEEMVWSGRPYLSIGVRYELTTQRLRIVRGLLGRDFEEIELVRVRDTSVKQHLGERALNVGDITIVSNDPQQPEVVLNNVQNPLEVRELIRKATMVEKKRRNLAYREEM